jgi:hypothetical protein
MPSRACNSEEIRIGAHVSEDFKSCMMLKQEVHLNTDPTNVFKHV